MELGVPRSGGACVPTRGLGKRIELWTDVLESLQKKHCMATSTDRTESAIIARALNRDEGNLSSELAESARYLQPGQLRTIEMKRQTVENVSSQNTV